LSDVPKSHAHGLLAAAGEDVELAQQLARLFLVEYMRLLTEVDTAATNGDNGGLQEAAHALRGCALSLSFDQVADAALAIELRARTATPDPADLGPQLERLAEACHAAGKATRAFLGE
jgi:HPt (histidine-containing phosphotransfer) domain-containing protein